MAETTPLDDAIRDNAGGPKRASGDAGSVEQHPLKDQIEADRHLNFKQASRAWDPGVRVAKLVPPGTC
jgi:hypothetical protein